MSNYNCLTMMILRKCRANYEELTSLINTGEEVVPFSYLDPVEFGNRGNWTVGNKLSEIDIVLIGEYVLLTTENGKCVESEIPGLKEGKVNLSF